MLAANSQYAASRPADIGQLGMIPSKQYLIVTCIDARIDPVAAFGISPGDAHVIRNAGGSAVAALRDIIVSTHFLGVKEVFIIKHRDCAMKALNGAGKPIFQQLYPEKIVCPGASSIIDMPWYDFQCPYGAVRQDWFFVQNHPAIRAQDPTNPGRNIVIHGFVYDPATGKLDPVEPRLPPSQNPIPGYQPNGDDPVESGGDGGGGGGSNGGGGGGGG
ncbi:putative carbonic anhydrase [Diaporthe ampelina]|uniref:Carbonic anhydrase n=1 Tax=Diaporthe ampelina TaxID=1214573 RepID=A0A0G2I565_9PEZI|nr:putative carbonic anhydrase [Diaporthe ampelina]